MLMVTLLWKDAKERRKPRNRIGRAKTKMPLSMPETSCCKEVQLRLRLRLQRQLQLQSLCDIPMMNIPSVTKSISWASPGVAPPLSVFVHEEL